MSPLNLAFSPDLQKSDLAQFGTLPGQGLAALARQRHVVGSLPLCGSLNLKYILIPWHNQCGHVGRWSFLAEQPGDWRAAVHSLDSPKAKVTVGVRWHQGQDRHILATCALTSSMPLQQRLHRNDPGPRQAPAMSAPPGGVHLGLSL